MRNLTALDAVIRLVDGVYVDLIFSSREQKDVKKRKQEEKDIKKLLKIRHGLVELYRIVELYSKRKMLCTFHQKL